MAIDLQFESERLSRENGSPVIVVSTSQAHWPTNISHAEAASIMLAAANAAAEAAVRGIHRDKMQ